MAKTHPQCAHLGDGCQECLAGWCFIDEIQVFPT